MSLVKKNMIKIILMRNSVVVAFLSEISHYEEDKLQKLRHFQ